MKTCAQLIMSRLRMARSIRNAMLLPIAVVLAGCAGSGEGLDQSGLPAGSETSAGGNSEFAVIQTTIFSPICANCHAGAGAPLGLQLDAANSYAQIVGVPSSEDSALLRVQPGNADASYLWQKIAGVAAFGDRMPQGGPFLPQSAIDTVRQWIENGALPPTVSNLEATAQQEAAGIRVIGTAPRDDGIWSTLGAPLVIGFDRELDINLVNATTVVLENIHSTRSVPVQFSLAVGNAQTLLIQPSFPLSDGAYRLTLRGAAHPALAGFDARPLNSGATTGIQQGTDFELHFKVEAR
jgi:hypothetical protein